MTVPPSGDPYAAPSNPVQGPGPGGPPPAPYGPPGQTAPYGPPAPYTPGAPPAPPTPTDGVSIAALVTGILGMALIPVGLGIAGIVRTGSGRRRGRGLAIAGLVLGALSTVVWGIVLAVVLTLASNDEARNAFTEGFNEGLTQGQGRAGDLEIGECLKAPQDVTDPGPRERVDCAVPHAAETFAVHTITAATYPNQTTIDALVDEQCMGSFENYVGAPYAESALLVFWGYPSTQSWAEGDRQLVCVITSDDGTLLEGSVAGSGL